MPILSFPLAIWNNTEAVTGYTNIFIPGRIPILVPTSPRITTRSTGMTFELVKENDAVPLMKGRRNVRVAP